MKPPDEVAIVSWNVAGRAAALTLLGDFDVALLQEAPLDGSTERIEHGPGPAAVLSLGDRVRLREIELVGIAEAAAGHGATPVSCPGTVAAAELLDGSGEPFLIVVSVYAKWEKTGSWIVSDASAHRLVSDLSALITTERHHVPIIVAGDWNLFRGAGETPYWQERYATVFDRMEALGFVWVGPTAGRHSQPPSGSVTQWPSDATPTFHTTRDAPDTAWRQLDHVFASERIADRVTVHALNDPPEWGPSDHCRIAIRYR